MRLKVNTSTSRVMAWTCMYSLQLLSVSSIVAVPKSNSVYNIGNEHQNNVSKTMPIVTKQKSKHEHKLPILIPSLLMLLPLPLCSPSSTTTTPTTRSTSTSRRTSSSRRPRSPRLHSRRSNSIGPTCIPPMLPLPLPLRPHRRKIIPKVLPLRFPAASS